MTPVKIICERCRESIPDRDVSDWPVIDDLNASDHCLSCWSELAKKLGRHLGRPGDPPGSFTGEWNKVAKKSKKRVDKRGKQDKLLM